MSRLQTLHLQNNLLTKASLPSELGANTRLISLDVGSSGVHGSLPSEVGKWESLVFLGVENNDLTGA